MVTDVAALAMVLRDLPLDSIDVEGNPRTDFGDLEELAASIRQHGVLQPIRVRADGDRFRLVYGQRRLLAARLAGLATIPATIAERDEAQRELAVAIVENIQREDLNPIAEARAIERLIQMGQSTAEIGLLLGRSQAHVQNRLRMLRADPIVVEAVESGAMSGSAAVALAALPQRQQKLLAKRVVQEHWSLNKLENFLRPQRIRAQRAPSVPIAPEAPSASQIYADGIAPLTAKVNDLLARLTLWTIVEMDVFVQGRFKDRHRMGFRGDDDTAWHIISGLPATAVAAEFAQVLGEMIAEYGTPHVKAAVPRKAAR